jgi:hypothetical protein
MKNILLAFIFIAATGSFAFAQSEKEKTQQTHIAESKRAEMKNLDRLIGQWKGAGWIQQGATRETFEGTETVQRKIGGLALLVEGNFKNKEGVVTHDTLAVISPNTKTKNYDFQTYLANGMTGVQELKAVEGGWQWGFQFQGGAIRYTIKIENDVWGEIGEISRDDGKTWMKFFEMSLKKVG